MNFRISEKFSDLFNFLKIKKSMSFLSYKYEISMN